ncbi:MAG: pilin [Patescibacteria group bacterium]|jgi:hypothetical protein
MKILRRKSTSRSASIALLTSILFFYAGSALAATSCCICTHPQVKNGQFCLKDVNTSCDSLQNMTNADLKNASCSADTSANPCKKVPAGKCLNEPSDVASFKLTTVPGYSPTSQDAGRGTIATSDAVKTLDVKLNIDIPGLTFFAPYRDENEIIVPIFAQYVQAFQKLLIGISLIATAIMIMYGGFLYIISGTGAKVREGKKILTDAIIGLVITLGAVVILSNVNPNAASMNALHLTIINSDLFSVRTEPMYDAAPGTGPKSSEEAIAEGARMAGADPCNVLAFCEHETGLRQIWNGWPNNQKEKSFMFGACSGWSRVVRDGQSFDKKLRAAFPGQWPDIGTDLPVSAGSSINYESMPIKAELLINNSQMDGYLAGLELKTATIDSVANAGIGAANIQRWRLANGCIPQKNLTLAQAVSMGADAAIIAACLPVAAAGGAGCPQDNHNCSPVDESKINAPTKGYKIESNGVIHGKCATTGNQCFTIWTVSHVRYAIASYARFDAKYHCSAK